METNPKIEPVKSKKDRWEKIDIILRPIGGLITAITIACISIIASNSLSKYQEREEKTKLYAELMTRREDSESALRKDMFNSIMSNILKDNIKATLDEKILQLELLTYNFHESLNLMPLFEYLDRRNDEENELKTSIRKNFKLRLIKMAKAVSGKQLSTLETVSKPEIFIYEDSLYSYKNKLQYKNDVAYKKHIDSLWQNNSAAMCKGEKTCVFTDSIFNEKTDTYDSLKYIIRIDIAGYNTLDASVQVSMKITTEYLGKIDRYRDNKEFPFSVNYYEFPMIDNTRLQNDMRLAVVLSDLSKQDLNTPGNESVRVELKVVFFPGSRSGLREKPYFDDIVSKLLPKN